jgi:hypothetical protein
LYNNVRLHSALGYITPKDRLQGRHQEIAESRDRKLADARERRKQVRQAEHQRQQGQPAVTTEAAPDAPARPPIDFAAVRAAVTLAAVLQLLGFEPLSTHGAQQRGPCPLHRSSSGTSRCFSANLDLNAFRCFQCGRSGNALDLWTQAHSINTYDAAVDLCARLNLTLPILATRSREEEPVAAQPATCTMEAT